MNLSRRIRDLRYAKGWGPDELASRAKISRTALYQIERGNTSKPQAGTLRSFSALGVPLEVLLTTTTMVPNEDAAVIPTDMAVATATPAAVSARVPSSDRAEDLLEKFRLLLASPLAEGIARIVEESFPLCSNHSSSHFGGAIPLCGADRVQAGSSESKPIVPSLSDQSDVERTWNHR